MTDQRHTGGAQEKAYDEILEFLRQLGWPHQAISKQVMKTFFHGDYGLCEVVIYVGHEDVSLVIDPVVIRRDEFWGEAVYRLVAAMRDQIQHIGIGIDEDGDLFVKVNLPIEQINLERFHCVLIALCQVAENMLLPVLQASAFDHLKAA